MNRDELDQERPVPATPGRRVRGGTTPRRRPASTTTRATDDLDRIFGGINAAAIRQFTDQARQAFTWGTCPYCRLVSNVHKVDCPRIREIAAMKAAGVDLPEPTIFGPAAGVGETPRGPAIAGGDRQDPPPAEAAGDRDRDGSPASVARAGGPSWTCGDLPCWCYQPGCAPA